MKSSVPPAAFDARASSLGTEKTLRKPLRHSKSAAYARQQATANQDPRGPTATTLLVSTGRQPTAFPLPPLKHTNRAKSGATTVARRSFVTQLTGDCQGRENRLSRTTAPSRAPRCTAGVLLPVTGAFTAPSDSRAAAVSFAKSSGSTLPDVQNHIGSLSDDTDWAADPGTSLSWASSNSTSAGSSVIYSSENRQHSRPETRKNNTSAPSRAQTALTLTRMAGSGRKSKQTARHLKDFECVSLVDVPLPKPERTPVDLSPYMVGYREEGDPPAGTERCSGRPQPSQNADDV
ncbi:hypothetical protein TGPRC2_240295 [Toxoplasma gondii TgCatPRC2]|uniref:Uncharacterized protein n=3 Tax=Toxoplasma gondii TaxID=5811 RepID=A0A125YW23_TOXGV|nr:hypothetical protein TGME49_240295 [Toxoplasma gondii ME49]EPT30722.1 hypothetical protein TGME49_240295 [Toxoplasma gondii ME49]ESS31394.1 hypothetical protein TGVEG_240295 [Toxoplasma gondii VEG]KYK66115.1 hypothetical protein TGPRC2_240295 [Toxoplasma gondii TgCatPRC2]|eukprot:XP_018637629.1 hypothetical protein TGME49_240295 [Toxoplasma gondii ME49]